MSKFVSSRKGLVLIIEDDPISMNILVNIFKSEGYKTLQAEDGHVGLDLMLSKRPDLVCLDVVLPRLSGYEVCQAARKTPELSSMPILMITSLDKKDDVVKGLKSGATDYITKPFSPIEVIARARVNLEQKFFLDRLTDRSKKFRLAYEVLETTTSSLDIKQVLFILVERTATALKAERCSIIAVEGKWGEDKERLKGRVLVSHDDPNMAEIPLDLSKYPEIIKSFRTGELVLIEDIQTDPIMEDVREKMSHLGMKSIIAVPLTFRGEIMGALLLRSSRPGKSFTDEEIAISRVIAGASSNAIKNATLYRMLERKTGKLLRLNEELIRTNEELQYLSNIKSDFVATVSHELRTPLTAIIGFSELLSEEHVGDLTEEQKEYTGQIYRKGKDLLNLINDILDTGRLEEGKIAFRFKPVDFREIINDVIFSTRHVTSVEPDIQTDIPEDMPQIEADRDKLLQIMNNIVSNALKYSDPGSPVQIDVKKISGRRETDHSDLVQISVTDKGIGIPDDCHQKVFEQFFQVDQGTSRPYHGAGLGLFIAKSMVELHGGKIWLDSIPDKGTSFHFTIPMKQN
jgi:signal transduction histidine kinase/DNA-binding response OmpR family regulator